MNVIQLRRPQALLIPDIQDLLKRAIDSGALLAPAGFDTVAADLFNFVTDENQFMFLGEEDGKFQAVILGFLPAGNLFPYPTVVLLYNEGSHALRRAMGEALMDFLMSSGYTRMLAVNSSGHPDAPWLKALTPADARGSIVGSLALFEAK